MAELFGQEMIERLAKQLNEPAWMTELRRKALARYIELPWPHKSDDVWRRTDVSQLDFQRTSCAFDSPSLLQSLRMSESQLQAFTQPLGHEALAVRANGSWVACPTLAGVRLQQLEDAAREQPEALRRILEADGFSEAEQKLSSLNGAFHHDDVVVEVAPHTALERPIRVVHLFSASSNQAIFPLTILIAGKDSHAVVIDEYVSLDSQDGEGTHLVNGRIELALEPGASLHYVRLQRWGSMAREFLLQRAQLAQSATLTAANINLGSALSKAHLVTRLSGEHSSAKLYGFVFGCRRQHIDQHTLQDHQAPHTTSDLLFKAALQDHSRMIYTGLIRIAKEAKQTQAYQANHDLLLSDEAKAETIPMLEILADDVQCKHGASIGPIDDEQIFYGMSRGVSREIAQRLIVMGFVESVIQKLPFEPLQERLRQEIEESLQSEIDVR
jgi:Fe-S cluster assembly protein SufD